MYFEHQMDIVHEQNKTLLKENKEMKSKITELVEDKEEFDDRFEQLFRELYLLKEKTKSDNYEKEIEWKAKIFMISISKMIMHMYVLLDNIYIIDISDPSNPFEITQMENTSGVELIIADEFAYLLSAEFLQIIDISDPYSPFVVGMISLPEISWFVQSLCIANNTVYVAGEAEIIAIDVTNKTVPEKVGLIKNFGYTISNKKLAVQTNTLGELELPGIVFCADYNQGFLIFNFTNPAEPKLLSAVDMGTQATAVSVDEQYVYLCTRHASPWIPTTLEIISWSDPSSPTVVGSYQTNDSITDVSVSNNLAYIAIYDQGLEILNLTNPAEPKRISNYFNNSDWGAKLVFDEARELIVLANYGAGYAIIDVSSPTTPTLTSQGNPWSMNVVDVCIDGNFLYLADNYYTGGFGIIDISDPSSPRPITRKGLGERVFSIAVEDGVAYLSTDITPLHLFDVTTPSNPQKLSEYYTGWWWPGHNLLINDSLVYVARDANGLMIIDVNNPKKPKLLAVYRDHYAGLSYDVTVFGETIFLADGWDGLEILELIPPEIPRGVFLTLTILPPITGFSLVAFIIIRSFKRKKESENEINDLVKE